MSDARSVEIVLEPQPHGGALARGMGRGVGRVTAVLKRLKQEAEQCVETLVAIRDDPNEDSEVRIKAAGTLLNQLALTRRKLRPTKRSTLSVVHATPAEQAAKVRAAAPPIAESDPPAEAKSGSRGPT